MGTIQVLQFAVLGLGLAGSLHAAHRLAKARYVRPVTRQKVLLPYVVLIIGLALLNVVLFLQPMTHRM